MTDAFQASEYAARFPAGASPVSIGYRTVELVLPEDAAGAQTGYAVSPDGESLCGTGAGDWREEWMVVATEDLAGDPIFADTADPAWPVYTARHGAGEWNPERIADSLQGFIAALEVMRRLGPGRSTPVALEANPIPEADVERTLLEIGSANPSSSASFWETWLREP